MTLLRTLLVTCAALVIAPACSSSDDKGSSGGAGDGGAAEAGGDSGASPDAGGGGGDACNTLCVDAQFASGKSTDFGSNVVECQCAGTSAGGGIKKPACEAYCGPLGVAPAKSFVTTEVSMNDKCVCDGT
ncbi:MAG: hypothetical protein KF819_16600 [Labilithrix sp.]|nr:hypothetical protein [Labilithrix sp.]